MILDEMRYHPIWYHQPNHDLQALPLVKKLMDESYIGSLIIIFCASSTTRVSNLTRFLSNLVSAIRKNKGNRKWKEVYVSVGDFQHVNSGMLIIWLLINILKLYSYDSIFLMDRMFGFYLYVSIRDFRVWNSPFFLLL